jgi:hypothetical protein
VWGGGKYFFRAKLLSLLMEVNGSYEVVLKVSQREIFVADFFTLSDPIRLGD